MIEFVYLRLAVGSVRLQMVAVRSIRVLLLVIVECAYLVVTAMWGVYLVLLAAVGGIYLNLLIVVGSVAPLIGLRSVLVLPIVADRLYLAT